MRIGVISDTHNFLDPAVPKLFAGVDYIVHAGDIGLPRIILELEQIAPVACVAGNTDDPACRYRETEVIELGGLKLLLHHIVTPYHVTEPLDSRLRRERAQVVVFGHTHKPFCQTIGGILFLNPGYAGKQRFALKRSLAILKTDAKPLAPEFLPLE